MPPALVLVLALALSLAFAARADSASAAPVPWNRPLAVPLYEAYPVIRDFRLNQAVEWAARGTLLGLVLGGVVAGLALEPQREGFSIVPLLVVSAGGTLGGLGGATGGYLRGRSWEARKARGESVHARREQVGFEVDAGNPLTGEDNNRDFGHLALIWRLPGRPRWAPDEYHLVVGSQSWHAGEDAPEFDSHAHEDRRGFRVLKSFRDALVNPFIGIGGGYSEGTAFDYRSSLPTQTEGRDFSAAYGEILAGVEFNAFDFFHARIQAVYEPFGPYRQISRHGDYDPFSILSIRSSLGTTLF